MKTTFLPLRTLLYILSGCLALTLAAAWLTPLESTLGGNLRLIYLHGAWVWTGIIAFSCAAGLGLAALIMRQETLHALSRCAGWTGLAFWLTYLPMSLLVMQINWNGFFFAEPRWQVPFTFAVISILLQAGLLILDTAWITSLANTVFGPILLISLARMQSVLHPDSPVFTSNSSNIKLLFALLLFFTLLTSAVLTMVWLRIYRPGHSPDIRRGMAC